MLRLFCAVVAASAPVWLSAQVPVVQPTFDVISIRPSISSNTAGGIQAQPGGRFVWTGTTVRSLIGTSFQRWGFDSRDVINGPDWIDTDRFDIIAQATLAPATDPDGFPRQLFQMVQNMLADRFRLVTHEEFREKQIYELVLVRKDGRLGPKLTKSRTDCAVIVKEQVGGRGFQRLPDGRLPCAIGAPPGRFSAAGLTMKEFSAALQGQVGRPVVDRTGLAGAWDWDLDFAPEFLPGRAGEPPPLPAAGAEKPSIFSALQEQLGLRLESSKGPVSVIVVDRVERPTPN